MNELEIRKIAKEEFINNVMYNIDSTLIFTYIQNLEQKVNNLQSKIDKANEILNKLEIQPAYLDCKYYELEGFKELKDVLKEVE